MTTPLPPLNQFDEVGSLFVKEFSFEDGCDKQRTLPLVIINRPTKVLTPSNDCITPRLTYTEWSSSAQFFRNIPDQYGCLDHIISVRVSMSSGSNVAQVKENVFDLLSLFDNSVPILRFGNLP